MFTPFFGGLNGDGFEDYDNFEYIEPSYSSSVKCHYCGKRGFTWKQKHSGKWWLWDIEKGDWHTCNKGDAD